MHAASTVLLCLRDIKTSAIILNRQYDRIQAIFQPHPHRLGLSMPLSVRECIIERHHERVPHAGGDRGAGLAGDFERAAWNECAIVPRDLLERALQIIRQRGMRRSIRVRLELLCHLTMQFHDKAIQPVQAVGHILEP
jgi:hypothetical protein